MRDTCASALALSKCVFIFPFVWHGFECTKGLGGYIPTLKLMCVFLTTEIAILKVEIRFPKPRFPRAVCIISVWAVGFHHVARDMISDFLPCDVFVKVLANNFPLG